MVEWGQSLRRAVVLVDRYLATCIELMKVPQARDCRARLRVLDGRRPPSIAHQLLASRSRAAPAPAEADVDEVDAVGVYDREVAVGGDGL